MCRKHSLTPQLYYAERKKFHQSSLPGGSNHFSFLVLSLALRSALNSAEHAGVQYVLSEEISLLLAKSSPTRFQRCSSRCSAHKSQQRPRVTVTSPRRRMGGDIRRDMVANDSHVGMNLRADAFRVKIVIFVFHTRARMCVRARIRAKRIWNLRIFQLCFAEGTSGKNYDKRRKMT